MKNPAWILVRQPSPDMSAAELTYMDRAEIASDVARSQHFDYTARLAEASGVEVKALDPLPGHADACFVEDTVIALPEVFVLCRPGTASRRGEVASIATALGVDRPVVRIEGPATLEGGDVLRDGRKLFVGLSSRTNQEGVEALRTHVEPFGYKVIPVDVHGALHLKTAVTVIAPNVVVMNPGWINVSPFADYTTVTVDPAEPFAGNALPLGEKVMVQAAHPRTAEKMHRYCQVSEVDIGEFAKAEAGLTCLLVLVPPH